MFKVAFIFPSQFGYFPDILEYCQGLSSHGLSVIFIGIDEGRDQVLLNDNQFKAFHSKKGEISFNKYATQILAIEKPNIVHVFHYRGAGLLKLLSFSNNSRWVLDIRTLHVGNIKGEMKGLYLKDKLTHLESLTYDKVLVLTETIKERIKPNIRKIKCIPLGGSKTKFDALSKSSTRETLRRSLKLQSSDIVFLYAGTINPSRRMDRFIEYFSRAIHNRDDIKLLVVGGDHNGGAYINHLKQQSSSNVLFTGKVKYTDVQHYYFASDVGVSYLPSGTPYEYQPATKVLEYMLARLLVFANVTKTQKDMTPHLVRGVLFEDSYSDFSYNFQNTLELINSNGHHSIVDNAYAYAQDYTWESIVEKRLLPFYHSVL
jgi:glycosyltransferase involved in cell wall biosynthesis